MVAPALVMEFAQGDTKRIAVIDRSGLVAEQLESNSEVEFVVVDASLPVAEAQAQLDNCFGVLRIGEQVLTNPNEVTLYTESSTSMTLEMAITNRIEDILENKKLLHRPHGSASPLRSNVIDLPVQEKSSLNADKKEAIARAANELIQDGDSILLTSIRTDA